MNQNLIEEAYWSSLISKFDRYGMLSDIFKYQDKQLAALVYSKAFNYITGSLPYDKEEGWESLIGPVLYRLLKQRNYEIELKNAAKFAVSVVKEFRWEYNTNYDKFEKQFEGIFEIDKELEFVKAFCDNDYLSYLSKAFRRTAIRRE